MILFPKPTQWLLDFLQNGIGGFQPNRLRRKEAKLSGLRRTPGCWAPPGRGAWEKV